MAAFLNVTTQWNCVGLGEGGVRVIGLNYEGARAALDLAGVAVSPGVWADLQLIELGARAAMNGDRV